MGSIKQRMIFMIAPFLCSCLLYGCSQDTSEENRLIARWRSTNGTGYPVTVQIDITSNGTEDIEYTKNMYWDFHEENLVTYKINENFIKISGDITEEEFQAYIADNSASQTVSHEPIIIDTENKIFTVNPSSPAEEIYYYEIDESELSITAEDSSVYMFIKKEE